MKKFLYQIFLLFVMLFSTYIAILFVYFQKDIYFDFKKYKSYPWVYRFQILGDLSVKTLITNNKNIKYNSFIFGSSRSVTAFACYLNYQIEHAKFFHFASWAEDIGGVYGKLKFLDSKNYEMNNVVIIIDTDFTFKGNGEIKENEHYLVSGIHKYEYYFKHLQSFFSGFNLDKFKILFGLQVNNDLYFNRGSDPYTNDHNHSCTKEVLSGYFINNNHDLIKKIDIDSYKNLKYEELPNQISKKELKRIKEIKGIFDKRNTNYTLIIGPLIDKKKFSQLDLKILKQVFGEENIYDFSGINNITTEIKNYPDMIHYKDFVSKLMLDSVLVKSYSILPK